MCLINIIRSQNICTKVVKMNNIILTEFVAPTNSANRASQQKLFKELIKPLVFNNAQMDET